MRGDVQCLEPLMHGHLEAGGRWVQRGIDCPDARGVPPAPDPEGALAGEPCLIVLLLVDAPKSEFSGPEGRRQGSHV